MKALIIDAEGSSRLGEIPSPELGHDDIRIAVKHVGLCGTDLNTYRGRNPLVTLPRIPGHEIGGQIIEIGASASSEYRVGQRVVVVPYTNCGECASCKKGRTNACRYNRTLGVQQEGAMTEEFVVSSEKIIVNDALDPRYLALVEPLAVGFHAVARGQVKKGDRVAVLGCGMIGLGILIGAIARGAEVIAVDFSEHKRSVSREFGASETLDPGSVDVVQRISELTNDFGVDVAFEAVGIPDTFTQCIDIASYAGRVVYVGYSKLPVTYNTALFNLKELDIMGSRNATIDDFRAVIQFLEQIGNQADKLISKQIPFEEADTAFDYWADNPDSLKIMVVQK
ncbi:zinc-binding alcohol dehydrogenase family protein [Brucella gallinifaecis]|nr:zinc-binding alcohol dehydrogenase family protein [Brucella gallinifaecis]